MGCNTPWEADSPARLAVRRPGVVQVPLVVVAVAAAVVVVVAAVVVAVAAAGAQVNLSHRRAAHCVHQTRQSAVGYMSHKSSRSSYRFSACAVQGRMTYPLLGVTVAIVGSSAK